MKQTAVEWLQEALEHTILTKEQIMQTIGLFEQAKEMEKQQIMDAYLIDGYTDLTNDYWRIEFEEYYNETFKSE